MKDVELYNEDCLKVLPSLESQSVDIILSDIPYGISFSEWDILHNNTNSALLGHSPSQEVSTKAFAKRGKPLNGWSEQDRKISKEYELWCNSWAREWLRVLKTGGSAFIFAGRRYAHRCISAMEDSGFIFKDMLAWKKSSAYYKAQRVSCVFDRRGDLEHSKEWEGWRLGNLRPIFEPILWFTKPYPIGHTLTDNILENGLGAFNADSWESMTGSCSNIIEGLSSNKKDTGLHPTQKPTKVLEALISLTTREGQVVLDPFMGSGSTGVACVNTRRKFIGIELNKEYFDIAEKRIKDAQPSLF